MNDSIVVSFVFPDAPQHHLGGKLETNEVTELGTLCQVFKKYGKLC